METFTIRRHAKKYIINVEWEEGKHPRDESGKFGEGGGHAGTEGKKTEDMVAVSGNTYPVKDKIKAMGGRWDADRKAWMVPKSKAPAAQALVPAYKPYKPSGKHPGKRDPEGWNPYAPRKAPGMTPSAFFRLGQQPEKELGEDE